MTNLRLPGQYDERLFAAAGISGLAGPQYNWNRCYLPAMGRYLELDPIALHGGLNGPFGPNWYGEGQGPVPETFPRTPRSAARPASMASDRRTSRDDRFLVLARSLRCRSRMTVPRQILPNATYLITRRCFDRRFMLRPSALVTEVFEYVLAVKAKAYGIQLHAYCVLSNHWHCVLSDPLGRLPEFQRDLGSTVARALNAAHGRWESFWAPGSYSAVALQTADDVLDKMAYVLANPALAGLVRRGAEWPGPWTAPALIGAGARLVNRPEHYFRKDGPAPPSAWLELTCPAGFTSAEDLRRRLGEELCRREDRAAHELAGAGRGFLGPARVLAQRPLARPAPGEPRRGLRPRVASRDKWRRLEALARLKSFVVRYRAALEAFAAGARETVFPEGTYWMRVNCGVPCASSG